MSNGGFCASVKQLQHNSAMNTHSTTNSSLTAQPDILLVHMLATFQCKQVTIKMPEGAQQSKQS